MQPDAWLSAFDFVIPLFIHLCIYLSIYFNGSPVDETQHCFPAFLLLFFLLPSPLQVNCALDAI